MCMPSFILLAGCLFWWNDAFKPLKRWEDWTRKDFTEYLEDKVALSNSSLNLKETRTRHRSSHLTFSPLHQYSRYTSVTLRCHSSRCRCDSVLSILVSYHMGRRRQRENRNSNDCMQPKMMQPDYENSNLDYNSYPIHIDIHSKLS